MASVFDMPIDELRDRADTVVELCAELLDLVPVLAAEPDLDGRGVDRGELASACEEVARLVRGSFRRIGELLPGVASLPPLPEGVQPDAARIAELRRFLDAQPRTGPADDRQPSEREDLVRRARDAMERREIFERVATAVGDLLGELRRLKLEVELRIGMPWTLSSTEPGEGQAN